MKAKTDSASPVPDSRAHLAGLGSSYSATALRSHLLRTEPAITPATTYAEVARLEMLRIAAFDGTPPGILLHHIGATAVPGLPAIPVLDLLMVAPVGTEAPKMNFFPLGYVLLMQATFGHPVFALNRSLPNDGGAQSVCFLHVVPEKSVFAQRSLLIRDILRSQSKWFTYYRSMRFSALEHKPDCYRALKGQFFSYLWTFHGPETPRTPEVAP